MPPSIRTVALLEAPSKTLRSRTPEFVRDSTSVLKFPSYLRAHERAHPLSHLPDFCSRMSHPSMLLEEPILYLYDFSFRERAESTSSRNAICSRASLHLPVLLLCKPYSLPISNEQFSFKRAYASLMNEPLYLLPNEPSLLPRNWPGGLSQRQGSLSTRRMQHSNMRDMVRVFIARKTLPTSSRHLLGKYSEKFERDLYRYEDS
ncbi:hypothetical protein V8E54_001960 [Elaphomyces granulatus]